MSDLTPIAEGRIQVRPPTFSSQSRHCGLGVGCAHFVQGACRHPQSEWGWGFRNSHEGRTPANRWPKKEVSDSCGWWRPSDSEVLP